MSLKARMRGLEGRVEWLETEGLYRQVVAAFRIVEMLQIVADRCAADPEMEAKWKKEWPSFPYTLPPPSPHIRRREPEPVEPAPRVGAILRDDALRASPQDEEVRVEPEPAPPEPAHPHPEERVARQGAFERERSKRPEGWATDEVRVEPGMPTVPLSPDMEIRPVQWRRRDALDDDDYDDRPGTYGRCLTEYDPMSSHYYDDDYD